MASKHKTAETLSEAFLAVRKYLCDGDLPTESGKTQMICFAARDALNAKRISREHCTEIRDIVEERLSPVTTVRSYLSYKHGGVNPTVQQVQDYRHAWLIHLSEEFKGK